MSLAATILAIACNVGSAATLDAEMKRLGVHSVLVLASQEVDERPVWSPSGEAIAVNVDGKWRQVDLRSVVLEPGKWRGDSPIGVLTKPTSTSSIGAGRVKGWEKSQAFDPRKIRMGDGKTVELRQDELSTVLMITKPGEEPVLVWRSGMENCHSLARSPDGRFVAYICESNGVVVTRP